MQKDFLGIIGKDIMWDLIIDKPKDEMIYYSKGYKLDQ